MTNELARESLGATVKVVSSCRPNYRVDITIDANAYVVQMEWQVQHADRLHLRLQPYIACADGYSMSKFSLMIESIMRSLSVML